MLLACFLLSLITARGYHAGEGGGAPLVSPDGPNIAKLADEQASVAATQAEELASDGEIADAVRERLENMRETKSDFYDLLSKGVAKAGK